MRTKQTNGATNVIRVVVLSEQELAGLTEAQFVATERDIPDPMAVMIGTPGEAELLVEVMAAMFNVAPDQVWRVDQRTEP